MATVLFRGFFFFFFLRELMFADRGQSVKFAKIRTRKIFMLQGIFFRFGDVNVFVLCKLET